MDDQEILDKVKQGLSVDGNDTDETLKVKIMAVKQYMMNAGIAQTTIETELGIAALTIGVNDIWQLSPGEIKFSFAFEMCFIPQLQAISI
ncbi:hypothetical protein CDLVIII_1340 [Clostridium sp. DL-VIII]|uniref:phage gp6-like head-tail connector protein n=1 Tax=Clostridium sp. DL-VIII TaxID=641107 RepID=UPI00023AF83B|nr:phage gp6-like head-tail connector protein [Clostridium sp. DL-VIII]EHI98039.1 hypothetical protein CDLVIII_1340 [Clostridium sp. DL-VIII]